MDALPEASSAHAHESTGQGPGLGLGFIETGGVSPSEQRAGTPGFRVPGAPRAQPSSGWLSGEGPQALRPGGPAFALALSPPSASDTEEG